MFSETETPKALIKEAFVLEELFLDQLLFKFGAMMNLYNFEKSSKREIISFTSQLKKITHENLILLKKNV